MSMDKTLEVVFVKAELELEVTDAVLTVLQKYADMKKDGETSEKIEQALALQEVMKRGRHDAKKVLAIRDLHDLVLGR